MAPSLLHTWPGPAALAAQPPLVSLPHPHRPNRPSTGHGPRPTMAQLSLSPFSETGSQDRWLAHWPWPTAANQGKAHCWWPYQRHGPHHKARLSLPHLSVAPPHAHLLCSMPGNNGSKSYSTDAAASMTMPSSSCLFPLHNTSPKAKDGDKSYPKLHPINGGSVS
jgi:hypothetical protein